MKNRPPSSECGVALVTTVIVVAVLAVVAVAFMQSTSTDRLSSRSVSNHFRAQLAADSGVALACSLMASKMNNDHFAVVANSNNQLFVGTGQDQPSGTYSYMPLLSSFASADDLPPSSVVTVGVPSVSVAGETFTTNFSMPGGLVVTSPSISWVYLKADAADPQRTNARVAFWVEDLGGKLDLSVVGSDSANEVLRPTGTNPAEIALWSIFNSKVPSDAANASAREIVSRRSSISTPATAALVSPDASKLLGDLAVRLGHDTNEVELVPYGFGYADEGKPKINLNSYVSSSGNVSFLASAISQNLPNFAATRSGARNPVDYLNNIAANIIDYADTGSDPTVDDKDNPSYLGIENLPWPNEMFDLLRFIDVTDAGVIRVELEDWIEVWNMGNEPSEPTTITVNNNYDMAIHFTNASADPKVGFVGNLKDAKFVAGAIGPREFNIPELQPNEYRVIPSSSAPPIRLLEWQSPLATTSATVKDGWVIYSPDDAETTNMSFKTYIGETMVQQSKDGRWPRHIARTTDGLKRMPLTPNRLIFCNPIGFATQEKPMSASSKPSMSGGDPRAQIFLSGPLRPANYNSAVAKGGYASPGGRNWEQRNIGQFPSSEVNAAKYWPDSGHASDADRGDLPVDYTEDPNASRFKKDPLTNNFVMRRNDAGLFTNIVELGNVYDPMQWADSGGSAISDQPGLWTNLTKAASPDARFGGRNTLRVGRWEFSRFTNTGTRASQLLDVFAAGLAEDPVVRNRIPGRININTASDNVLRALAAGVSLTSDRAIQMVNEDRVLPVKAIDAFVEAVKKQRDRKPFFSTSELALLARSEDEWPGSAVFGNPELAQVIGWNDGASEEWFSKVYPLAAVRSRNFLIFAVGQALEPGTGKVVSTARSAFQVYMEPLRDPASGLVTNCLPRIVQSWNLSK
jgi:hypothetical protein